MQRRGVGTFFGNGKLRGGNDFSVNCPPQALSLLFWFGFKNDRREGVFAGNLSVCAAERVSGRIRSQSI